ncbi:MAG: Crp/Fnr family transcriptional regulator [Henriciella sp.]
MDQVLELKQHWAAFIGGTEASPLFDDIAQASRAIHLQPGDYLVSQGDTSQTVFLLVDGGLKAVRYSQNGHEIWLSSFAPHALIGEMSGLTGTPRSSTVICVQPSTVLAVEFADFEQAVLSNPAFGLKLSRLLAERVRNTSTHLEELATLQTSARLHSELYRLGVQDSQDDERATITSPPSVSELAVRIHAARESTSRALSLLQKRGFLKRHGDGALDVISPKSLD